MLRHTRISQDRLNIKSLTNCEKIFPTKSHLATSVGTKTQCAYGLQFFRKTNDILVNMREEIGEKRIWHLMSGGKSMI